MIDTQRVSAARSSMLKPCVTRMTAAVLRTRSRSAGERRIGGQHLECQRLQRIPGQDRRRLVELTMNGGAAAPQIVVVHGRQVVVDERVSVDQLDGCGDWIERRFRRADELAARIHQQRTNALTAAEHGVAHGVEQSFGNMVAAQSFGELAVDSATVMIETLRECDGGAPCYHREPS